MLVYNLENEILAGNINIIRENLPYLNDTVDYILKLEKFEAEDIRVLRAVINIFNIIYNNSSDESSLIDDGIYDMLVAKLMNLTGETVPGAPLVDFSDITDDMSDNKPIQAVRFFDKKERKEKTDFYPELFRDSSEWNNIVPADQARAAVLFPSAISKRTHSAEHGDSNLVGTLDKCKFVLIQDAINANVDIDDPKIKILERDFFAKHIMDGIIDPDQEYTIIISLKYDGCSIEADCSNIVEGARSRGDTGIGLAADMTPILKGYAFPRACEKVGMSDIKFEAIMTYESLHRYNIARGKEYKNCRSAINGLFGASDAGAYRDYITLVPLDMSPEEEVDKVSEELFPNMRRLGQIAYLNSFYKTNGVPFICAVETGNYARLLFMIKKFLEEAEYARSYMGFMYDGIVVEYAEDDIREKLGRKNYVNQYAMAVKFNPLKKQTHFRGYTYTVGKDGSITPMIHYDPVEFMGTIHPKSSGQSYSRFMELGLKVGDIIDVTYTNDVMPYVTRPDNEYNMNNPNPIVEFPTACPICGGKIELSKSGKAAYCMNPNCEGRLLGRTVDMMYKLGFEGFADKSVSDIGCKTLRELMTIPEDKVNLNESDRISFIMQRENLRTRELYDYELLGSLGFTGMAAEKWKYVTKVYSLDDIIMMPQLGDQAVDMLKNVRGIGPKTAKTIVDELPIFMDDIIYAINNMNIKKGMDEGQKISIRYSGFRNKQLMEQLISMGYDAKDGSVTKSTDILLVPNEGYMSPKLGKIGPNTKVIPVSEFIENMELYLN